MITGKGFDVCIIDDPGGESIVLGVDPASGSDRTVYIIGSGRLYIEGVEVGVIIRDRVIIYEGYDFGDLRATITGTGTMLPSAADFFEPIREFPERRPQVWEPPRQDWKNRERRRRR